MLSPPVAVTADLPLRVFISYAHHDDAQVERTTAFANRLVEQGMDVRFDRFDPRPEAGWPLWMEDQIASADRILMMCTSPWVTRFNGRRDASGGRGVAWEGLLMRKFAYSEQSTTRFVPIKFDDDDVSIPTLFADQRVYVLDRDFERLITDLANATGHDLFAKSSRHAERQQWHILEPVAKEVSIYATPPYQEVAEAVAFSLGGPGPRSALELEESDDIGRTALIVVLGDDVALGTVARPAAAHDRQVIVTKRENVPRGASVVPMNADAIVDAAREALRLLARRWWMRAGVDIGLATTILGVAPVAGVVAMHMGMSSPWCLAFGCLLAAGVLTLSGMVRAMPDERLPIVHHGYEWRHTLSMLSESVTLAINRSRRRDVLVWALVLQAMITIPVILWLRSLPRLTLEQTAPILAALVLSNVLGCVSVLSWLNNRRRGIILASVLTYAATALPSVELHWGALDGELMDILHLVWPHPSSDPTSWLFAGPASLPVALTIATMAATVLLRALPRRSVMSARRLRAIAVLVAFVGLALAWAS